MPGSPSTCEESCAASNPPHQRQFKPVDNNAPLVREGQSVNSAVRTTPAIEKSKKARYVPGPGNVTQNRTEPPRSASSGCTCTNARSPARISTRCPYAPRYRSSGPRDCGPRDCGPRDCGPADTVKVRGSVPPGRAVPSSVTETPETSATEP